MGFVLSCEPGVGQLLAALAAAVPLDGRVLELGTGVGVGLSWFVHGLGDRTDVNVVTVDADNSVIDVARAARWPGYVRFELEDGVQALKRLGSFDLIFADAPAGKVVGLRHTITALRPGGVLVVDDMDLDRHDDLDLRDALATVRRRLLDEPALQCVELDHASGIIVAARRR